MVWYDWMKPSHAQLHSDYMQPLTEAKARSKNKVRSVQQLIQRLRLVKSPSEIKRMQIAGKLTSEVWLLLKIFLCQIIKLKLFMFRGRGPCPCLCPCLPGAMGLRHTPALLSLFPLFLTTLTYGHIYHGCI
jgi:hypothetical protein